MELGSSNLRAKRNLLKLEEVARRLQVSKTTIYRMVGQRSLPFYKVGGGLRFDEADIESYLGSNRVEPIRN